MARIIIIILFFSFNISFSQNENIHNERKVVIEKKQVLNQQEYLALIKTEKKIIKNTEHYINTAENNRKLVYREQKGLTQAESRNLVKVEKKIVKIDNKHSNVEKPNSTSRKVVHLEPEIALSKAEHLKLPKVEKQIITNN